MHAVFEQVIAKTRSLILARVMYFYPPEYNESSAAMYRIAESLDQTLPGHIIGTSPLMSNYAVADLAAKIGIDQLYTQGGWRQGVDDYILANKAECTVVWDMLRAMVDQEAK